MNRSHTVWKWSICFAGAISWCNHGDIKSLSLSIFIFGSMLFCFSCLFWFFLQKENGGEAVKIKLTLHLSEKRESLVSNSIIQRHTAGLMKSRGLFLFQKLSLTSPTAGWYLFSSTGFKKGNTCWMGYIINSLKPHSIRRIHSKSNLVLEFRFPLLFAAVYMIGLSLYHFSGCLINICLAAYFVVGRGKNKGKKLFLIVFDWAYFSVIRRLVFFFFITNAMQSVRRGFGVDI